ncbi:hypothetical protein B0H13DRAFT_1921922 [Mycena leptocephala]|nr:hypothetical protein B0H13DRAFT_1921922 [Mycena leptocephala]
MWSRFIDPTLWNLPASSQDASHPDCSRSLPLLPLFCTFAHLSIPTAFVHFHLYPSVDYAPPGAPTPAVPRPEKRPRDASGDGATGAPPAKRTAAAVQPAAPPVAATASEWMRHVQRLSATGCRIPPLAVLEGMEGIRKSILTKHDRAFSALQKCLIAQIRFDQASENGAVPCLVGNTMKMPAPQLLKDTPSLDGEAVAAARGKAISDLATACTSASAYVREIFEAQYNGGGEFAQGSCGWSCEGALDVLVNWRRQHGGTRCRLVCGIFSTERGSRGNTLSVGTHNVGESEHTDVEEDKKRLIPSTEAGQTQAKHVMQAVYAQFTPVHGLHAVHGELRALSDIYRT